MSNLFQMGNFILASGLESRWKIECDALTSTDWDCLAEMIRRRFNFGGVTGVPTGGLPLEERLRPHASPHVKNYLIVDDVYTTGRALHRTRAELVSLPDGGGRFYMGVVVFARSPLADVDRWIRPIFQYWGE